MDTGAVEIREPTLENDMLMPHPGVCAKNATLLPLSQGDGLIQLIVPLLIVIGAVSQVTRGSTVLVRRIK